MKMKHYFLLAGLVLAMMVSGCSSSKGLTKEEKAAQEAVLRQAIESRTFYIDVNRMIPTSGKSQALTSSYSVEIKENQIKSYLPYFGRVHSVPYGGGNGLIFDATINDYKISYDKRGKASIELKTETPEDNYTYRIEIFPNGTTSINVSMQNRQSISFYGTAYAKNPRR